MLSTSHVSLPQKLIDDYISMCGLYGASQYENLRSALLLPYGAPGVSAGLRLINGLAVRDKGILHLPNTGVAPEGEKMHKEKRHERERGGKHLLTSSNTKQLNPLWSSAKLSKVRMIHGFRFVINTNDQKH